MATWTDGAAYAPLERPDGFATPLAPPLPAAAVPVAVTPGPIPPPHDFAPTGPAVPLQAIASAPKQSRNPGEPFAVAAGMLSAGGASATIQGPRDPRRPFDSTSYSGVGGGTMSELPPPSGDPLPPPTGAPLAGPMDMVPYGYPTAPGSVPAPWGAPAPRPAATQQQVALVWCALAAALLGLLVPAGGPWLLVVAGAMTLRTQALTQRLGPVMASVGLSLVVLSAMLDADQRDVLVRLAALVFSGLLLAAALRARRNPR